MDSVKSTAKVSLSFYKNPVFWFIAVYVSVIVGGYVYMDTETRDEYLYGSQFRDGSGNLQISKMLFYPYGTSTVGDILLTVFTSPLFLYLLVVSVTVLSFVDLTKKMSYFYAIMYSFICLFVLYLVHSVTINVILGVDKLPVEPEPEEVSYNAYYKTKWIATTVLSPIYVMLLVFLGRLGK